MGVLPLTIDTGELAKLLGISLGTAKSLFYSATIPSFLVGRHRLIAVETVHELVRDAQQKNRYTTTRGL